MWPGEAPWQEVEIRHPEVITGLPALVLAFSATVANDRVTSVLGYNVSIWTVTVARPHNDMATSRNQLSLVRAALRIALDRIKAAHGQSTRLHIFPATPVSIAVELGVSGCRRLTCPGRFMTS